MKFGQRAFHFNSRINLLPGDVQVANVKRRALSFASHDATSDFFSSLSTSWHEDACKFHPADKSGTSRLTKGSRNKGPKKSKPVDLTLHKTKSATKLLSQIRLSRAALKDAMEKYNHLLSTEPNLHTEYTRSLPAFNASCLCPSLMFTGAGFCVFEAWKQRV